MGPRDVLLNFGRWLDHLSHSPSPSPPSADSGYGHDDMLRARSASVTEKFNPRQPRSWIAGKRLWILVGAILAFVLLVIVIPAAVVTSQKSHNSAPASSSSPSSSPGSPSTATSGAPAPTSSPEIPVDPKIALPIGSEGCGQKIPRIFGRGLSVTDTITANGEDREYLVYLPTEYNITAPSPVVFSYHGRGETSYDQEELTGLSTEDDGRNPGNWVVVYPQGINNSWQGAPYNEGANDVAFTTSILDVLSSTLCLDMNRIYATGKSNGGGFAALLACDQTFSTKLAAVAPVSGAFYPDIFNKCQSSRVVPIFDIHGAADTTIEYDGGTSDLGWNYLGIEQVYEGWAKRQQCDEDLPLGGWGYNNTWTCDKKVNAGAKVMAGGFDTITQLKVEDMGHVWPSDSRNDDCPRGCEIDATSLIVDFFGSWAMKGWTGNT